MTTDTPETDAAGRWGSLQGYEIVDTDFARKLERERDEARKVAEFWHEVACRPFVAPHALPWKA